MTSIKFAKRYGVSQSVSESVSDKHCQWSDSGPIKTNTNAAISKPCTYMECTYQGEPEMQQFAEKPWEGVGAVQCKGLHWGGSASIVGMKAVCAGSYWINSNCSYISAILCFWINSNCSIYQLSYVSDRQSVSSQGTLTFKKVQSTTYNVYLCYACNVFSCQKIPQWLYIRPCLT